MDIGMLWFDDSPRTMDEKIKRAVDFYTEKYGRSPTVCMVHPTTAQADGIVGGVQVRPARSILPHHFLVGIEDDKANGKGVPAKPRPVSDSSRPAPDAGQGDRQLTLDLNDEAADAKTERSKPRRGGMPALDGQAA